MPIRPEQRALYPSDWLTISRAVKEAAGWRCVECGVAHGAIGARGVDGDWRDVREIDGLNSDTGYCLWPDGYPKIITICLTVGHRDHNPANNDPANLAAWCQRCHNRYDGKVRARHAAETRARKRGQAPLVGLGVGA